MVKLLKKLTCKDFILAAVCLLYTSITYPQINQQANLSDLSYQVGLYLLCLLLILLIAAYRVKNRMPELAVRKILGQEIRAIALLVFVENLVELMASFCLYFVARVVFSLNIQRSIVPMAASDVSVSYTHLFPEWK